MADGKDGGKGKDTIDLHPTEPKPKASTFEVVAAPGDPPKTHRAPGAATPTPKMSSGSDISAWLEEHKALIIGGIFIIIPVVLFILAWMKKI